MRKQAWTMTCNPTVSIFFNEYTWVIHMTTHITCSHVGNARVSRCECIPMAARGWHHVFLDDSLPWVCHLNLKLANLASLASQFIWGSSVSSSGALGLQATTQHLPGAKHLNSPSSFLSALQGSKHLGNLRLHS